MKIRQIIEIKDYQIKQLIALLIGQWFSRSEALVYCKRYFIAFHILFIVKINEYTLKGCKDFKQGFCFIF